jgi:thioredoxin reductase (NADPH)
VEGVFIAIGHTPNTWLFKDQLGMDSAGYLHVTPGTTHTTIKGVFACGDVADNVYRQAVTSAGTGAMAAIDAERWLDEEGKLRAHLPLQTSQHNLRIC